MTHYIEQTLLEVFENYSFRGHRRCGEHLTYAQHMAQCAALARAAGHDDEVVLAAFFHDIGSIVDREEWVETVGEHGLSQPEEIGPCYLRDQGFSERVAELVEGLFEAKRYLAYQDQRHLQKLALAGRPANPPLHAPMNQAEAERFEERLDFLMCLKIREWDDAAKRIDLPPVSIEPLKEVARRHLKQQLGDLTLAR